MLGCAINVVLRYVGKFDVYEERYTLVGCRCRFAIVKAAGGSFSIKKALAGIK